MNTPTINQLDIINFPKSLTVLAKPGSGKTFTIAEKIKKILINTLDFKGIIAISYTNKASKELKDRVVKGGIDSKQSFFGTISSFYLNEVIYKFAYYLFDKPNKEVLVYSSSDNLEEVLAMDIAYKDSGNPLLSESLIPLVKENFQKGIISLSLVDAIAIYVFDSCKECQNYMKSRYTHIFIDEYQDCGLLQDMFFQKMMGIGLVGVAVGDKDQAIYQFAGKDSKYLLDLPTKHGIKTFLLDKNFRCHDHIKNYALRLLDGVTVPGKDDERIIRMLCKGNEIKIANAIDLFIPLLKKKGIIETNSQIAILTRNERTGDIVSNNLVTKNIFFKRTPLDEDSSMQGLLFKEILISILGNRNEIFDLCNSYINMEEDSRNFNNAYTKLMGLRTQKISVKNIDEIVETSYLFILREQKNEKSIEKLYEVLVNEDFLNTYMPQEKDLVQIMTLHKSKGLEFEVVFHLDLYKYIMPMEEFNPNRYKDLDETINLHYVGITRAKKFCFLVTSEKRTNSEGLTKPGIDSVLLVMNDLNKFTMSAKELYNTLNGGEV